MPFRHYANLRDNGKSIPALEGTPFDLRRSVFVSSGLIMRKMVNTRTYLSTPSPTHSFFDG